VTAVFLALLAWLIFETQGGGALGLAERLVSAVEETWPLVVTLALRYAAEPADFTELVTPDDSSAVQEIAKAAPAGAHVGKAFNTLLPSVLAVGQVERPLDLFIAGDGDAEALPGGRANEEVVGIGALRGGELGRNRT
jgi:predicted dinucleotide-binding enzyme